MCWLNDPISRKIQLFFDQIGFALIVGTSAGKKAIFVPASQTVIR
jgi:hypothetical protein